MHSIKHKTINSIIWNFTEKLAVRLGQFVISIILARLLSPEDFGLIAIIMFFLNISQVFIESGFSKALIQKTHRTDLDYSSVFVINLLLSFLFYLLLFVSAPFIASFYSEPNLTMLIRVLSLTLVLNSLVIVQNVILQVDVNFKKMAKINVVSMLLSGIVGVLAALWGLGVWSLVIQSLLRSIISYFLFTSWVKWKASFTISLVNLKTLWRFASNLLVAGFVSHLTHNVYNLLIGKYYSLNSLGYYNRANSLASIVSDVVTQAIQQVTFPVLSQMQDDKDRMISSFIKMIKMSAFIIFPIMSLLSVMAEPLIRILLTDVWLPVIPLLQWMAFTRLLYPLNALNLNILNATGRSDLFLKVDLSKLPITILALVITLPMGVEAMVIGQVVCGVLYYAVNTYMPGRLYGYGFIKQVKDLIPFMVGSIFLYAVSYVSVSYFESVYLQLLIGAFLGMISYLGVCYLMRVKELSEVGRVLQNMMKSIKVQ